MEQELYIAFAALLFGDLCYAGWKILKLCGSAEFILPSDCIVPPASEDAVDDFMCLMVSDGSTIISTGGVTVRGWKITE